jgi:hypothetical protein
MRPILTGFGVVLCSSIGTELGTDYEQERSLRIETHLSLELETVDFSMTRNGEPVEASFGADATSEEERHIVQLDHIQAGTKGRPTHVRRTFDTLEGTASMTFGENELDSEAECPLEGVVLDLIVDEEDELSLEIVDGEADDEWLVGHRPELALDALLPQDEVAEGDSWDLESESIARALGIDVAPVLFQRAEPEEGEGGGGRRGGRFGGGGSLESLSHIEWEGEATLTAASVDRDGVACAEIEISIEGTGDVPQPEGGFGGGRRRMPRDTRGTAVALVASAVPAVFAVPVQGENTISVKLEGTLYFALEARRPLSMHLRGEVETERNMERSNGDFSMSMYSLREGVLEYEITIKDEE